MGHCVWWYNIDITCFSWLSYYYNGKLLFVVFYIMSNIIIDLNYNHFVMVLIIIILDVYV